MLKEYKKITRKTKLMIIDGIKTLGTINKYDLCFYICEELENRFKGDTLEYQLRRMQLENTREVLNAIDTFMFKYFKKSMLNKDYNLK